MKNLVCIICPRGCQLTVDTDENSIKISGSSCKRGEKYAIDECTAPVRSVTSTVRISNRENTMVSVKTKTPIAKEDIFKLMKLIRSATATAPIKRGDIILHNVFSTDVIATNSIN